MHLIKDHVIRKIKNDMVLVPLSNKETDFNGMILLNHTAEFICRKLKTEIREEELIKELANTYQKQPEEVTKDVRRFLEELDQYHMLIK